MLSRKCKTSNAKENAKIQLSIYQRFTMQKFGFGKDLYNENASSNNKGPDDHNVEKLK